MRQLIVSMIVLVIGFPLNAQDQIGVNPPSMKWSRVFSPAGVIIYPRGLDSTALDLAYRINKAYLFGTAEVLQDIPSKQITTILQNQSVFPEGFATTVPWRQELYLTPPQNMFLGPSLWRDGLASHEYRHAQQFMAYDRGWSILYKTLMGNTGWLLSTVLNVPLWYREGDAVDVETRFTTGGRGTLPSFEMEYRTLRLNGIRYSYEKAVSASNFKDFVPNMYRSGYYMTTRLRRRYGLDIWAQILNQSSKKFLYPFSRTLFELTGEKPPQLYASTFNELDSIWARSDTITQKTGQSVTPSSKVFEKYRFPQKDHTGHLIVSHSSLSSIRSFLRLGHHSIPRKIKTAGVYNSDHENFTVEGKILAWAEAAFHPRYTNKTYSVIKYLDLSTGKITQLSHRSKYFSPAPSKDGLFMAVVEYNEWEKCSLKIINLANGKVVQSYSYNNQFLAQPRWVDEDQLVMICITKEGNQLVRLDLKNNEWEELLNAYDVNIANPFPYHTDIYFSCGLTGIENIYKIKLKTGEFTQVTNVRFGAFDPAVYNDTLYFANYDVDGYEIRKVLLNTVVDREVHFPSAPIFPSNPKYNNQEVHRHVDASYRIEPDYRGFFWNKFFYSYGWFPLIFPPELGMELNTLNMERSFNSTLGLNYNFNENIVQSRFMGSYAKLFPVINGGFTIQSRKFSQPDAEYDPENFVEIDSKEAIFSGGIEFPLRLTQGVYHSGLNIKGDFNYHRMKSLETQSDPNSFTALSYGFSFFRIKPPAKRQVQTPFGQMIQGHFKNGLEGEDPQQFYLNTTLYFPGILNTHSLNFRGSYENNENTSEYRYLSLFNSSRGYKYYPFDESYLLSINYEYPIFYPDYYINGLLGITRVRGNIFYDFASGSTTNFDQKQRSFGAEVIFDLRVFRAFNMDMRFQLIQRQDHFVTQDPFIFNIGVSYFELLN